MFRLLINITYAHGVGQGQDLKILHYRVEKRATTDRYPEPDKSNLLSLNMPCFITDHVVDFLHRPVLQYMLDSRWLFVF
jgi:hypothetical protein